MTIKKLIIENFGPYVEKSEVLFSNEPMNRTSLILGGNGQGKTCLMNAILWAFFGSDSPAPDFHSGLLRLLPTGNSEALASKTTTSVELEIVIQDESFTVKREQKNSQVDTKISIIKIYDSAGCIFFEGKQAQKFISQHIDQKRFLDCIFTVKPFLCWPISSALQYISNNRLDEGVRAELRAVLTNDLIQIKSITSREIFENVIQILFPGEKVDPHLNSEKNLLEQLRPIQNLLYLEIKKNVNSNDVVSEQFLMLVVFAIPIILEISISHLSKSDRFGETYPLIFDSPFGTLDNYHFKKLMTCLFEIQIQKIILTSPAQLKDLESLSYNNVSCIYQIDKKESCSYLRPLEAVAR